jgi:hypothetical protein
LSAVVVVQGVDDPETDYPGTDYPEADYPGTDYPEAEYPELIIQRPIIQN